MNFHRTFTGLDSFEDIADTMEAIKNNNAALAAKRAKRYDEAIRLHTKAVEAKVGIHGEESIHAAISFNGLGETYLKTGRIDEAADAFAKALKVRGDICIRRHGDRPAQRRCCEP